MLSGSYEFYLLPTRLRSVQVVLRRTDRWRSVAVGMKDSVQTVCRRADVVAEVLSRMT